MKLNLKLIMLFVVLLAAIVDVTSRKRKLRRAHHKLQAFSDKRAALLNFLEKELDERKWSYNYYAEYYGNPAKEDLVKIVKGWQLGWFSSPTLMNINMHKDFDPIKAVYKHYSDNQAWFESQVGLTRANVDHFKNVVNGFFQSCIDIARSSGHGGFTLVKIQ